jgi:ribonuclease BN (tRNA processing enzyme)
VRLTVIGCGTAQPQPDTPASGLLLESGDTRLLLDCGQGVISRLEQRLDPRLLTAVLCGHLHADHYIDIVGLRYLFPWAGRQAHRLPVLLPPGGRDKVRDLASAVSERPTFFDDAFEVRDYEPAVDESFGDLRVRFIQGRHYVPAWGVEITDASGTRLVYAGDTGPNDELVEAARGADLFVCEATLANSAFDDAERGHVTADEAIDMGEAAGVGRVLLVHYPTTLRETIRRRAADRGGLATVGVPDLALEVGAGTADPVPGETRAGVLEGG